MERLISSLGGIVSLALMVSGFILHLAGIALVFDFTENVFGITNFFKYIVAPILCFIVSLIPFSEFWIAFYPLLYKAINNEELSRYAFLYIPWWIWFGFFLLNLVLILISFLADRFND